MRRKKSQKIKNIIKSLKKFKILRPIFLYFRHYKINKKIYSRKVVFKSFRSKIINFHFMLVLTQKKYEQFINICTSNYNDIYDTKIPNYLYEPLALQIQEMYSRGDNRSIKKLFRKILHYSNSKKQNINKINKNHINDCVSNLIHGSSSFSTRSFPYLEIKSKRLKKYFSFIKISVESVGDSFFKIVFTCNFSDDFMYKFWLASTTRFIPEVELKLKINKRILINRKSAIDSKKEIIAYYEKASYLYLKKFLTKITKGIFWKILNDYPCTLISSLSNISYILYGGLQKKQKKTTSFFDAVIDSQTNKNTRYMSTDCNSIFIPISGELKGFNKVFLKHFKGTAYTLPTTPELSWYAILHYLLYHQSQNLINIKNKSYVHDINGAWVNFKKARDEINTISSVISIVKSEYEYQLEHDLHTILPNEHEYFDLNISDKATEYIDTYKSMIDFLFKKIDLEMNNINKIYETRYAITNNQKNINLQKYAIALMIISVGIPVAQFFIDKHQKKIDSENQILREQELKESINKSFNELEETISTSINEQNKEMNDLVINIINDQKENFDKLINHFENKK